MNQVLLLAYLHVFTSLNPQNPVRKQNDYLQVSHGKNEMCPRDTAEVTEMASESTSAASSTCTLSHRAIIISYTLGEVQKLFLKGASSPGFTSYKNSNMGNGPRHR